jgi:hypothetical protein
VQESFRRVCLTPYALLPLFLADPAAAKEVLLATCILPPHERDPYGGPDLLEDLETWRWHDGMPPLYFRGPFLSFPQLAPEEGLDVILRLVNFATARWEEWRLRRLEAPGDAGDAGAADSDPSRDVSGRSVSILLPSGSKRWRGDARVYGWYRGPFGNAHLVVACLMALEKWLYDELDAGRGIERWLEIIFARCDSVAFAGVLSALARRRPALLTGALRPLMSVWQLYGWEHRMLHEESTVPPWSFSMIQWVRYGEAAVNRAREWHLLEHRKVDLLELAISLLLREPSLQEWFETVRVEWQRQTNDSADREQLELLVARFDPKNYRFREQDGIQVAELQWPDHLQARVGAALVESEETLARLSMPSVCRQILDGERSPPKGPAVDSFWMELIRLSAPRAADRADQHAALVCGMIAVLLRFQMQWLRQVPQRLEHCLSQLDAVDRRQPRGELDLRYSSSPLEWDCFFGEAAVELLVSDPAGPLFRRWAGHHRVPRRRHQPHDGRRVAIERPARPGFLSLDKPGGRVGGGPADP